MLTSGHLLAEARITQSDIEQVVNAWMYCSYASEPRKHEVKKWLNHLLLTCLTQTNVEATAVKYETKSRPKILVIHERFSQKHAMFRCYAPLIRTLGKYFDTVALADSALIDEAADSLFDEVLRLEKKRPSLEQIIELIQAQKADVIWYPSLGMGALDGNGCRVEAGSSSNNDPRAPGHFHDGDDRLCLCMRNARGSRFHSFRKNCNWSNQPQHSPLILIYRWSCQTWCLLVIARFALL